MIAASQRTMVGMTSIRERRGLDVAAVRDHFPALGRTIDGVPLAYLDGPGGTQVPRDCIDAITAYLERSNANHGGAFPTSIESDAILDEAHAAGADFVGAHDPDEIVFGPNMTTLTFAMSRALGRDLHAGDEIVVTRLDHDANVAPWLAVAEDRGATVRWLELADDRATLDLDRLDAVLSPRTRVVAVGLASNALGTVTDVGRVIEAAHAVGAIAYVDAVHAAPSPADRRRRPPGRPPGDQPVQVLRAASRHALRPPRAPRAADRVPGPAGGRRLAGQVGDRHPEPRGAGGPARHVRLSRGARRGLWRGRRALRSTGTPARRHGGHPHARAGPVAGRARAAGAIRGLRLYGIADPGRVAERVPTFSFTLAGHHPRAVAEHLARRGISVWDGDFYACELIRALGLSDGGGLVRIGFVHYNTIEEVDRLGDALEELAR